jgi:hypothetical protein
VTLALAADVLGAAGTWAAQSANATQDSGVRTWETIICMAQAPFSDDLKSSG